MKKVIFWCIVLLAGVFISSCKRSDDEPVYPPTPISRLYVSFDDEQTDPTLPLYKSIVVFAKADSATFGSPDTLNFTSRTQIGSGVFFDPNLGRVFQGNEGSVEGVNGIQLYTVSNTGVLGSSSNFADTLLLESKDLLYDHTSENLYVSSRRENLQGNGLGYIHVYNKPANLNGTRRQNAHTRYQLPTQPWGLAYRKTGDQLMVAMINGGNILLLDTISRKQNGDITADKTLHIQGAVSLRGIAYSEKLDLLAVTDIGEANQSNAKVYVIENAMAAFNSGTIQPARILSGIDNEISEPTDVAIDDRDGENFLYIVDHKTKMILRYPLDASGDVAAQASYSFAGLPKPNTPISIHLDAREGAMDMQ